MSFLTVFPPHVEKNKVVGVLACYLTHEPFPIGDGASAPWLNLLLALCPGAFLQQAMKVPLG